MLRMSMLHFVLISCMKGSVLLSISTFVTWDASSTEGMFSKVLRRLHTSFDGTCRLALVLTGADNFVLNVIVW
jgi:hypothetical protein